MHLIFECAAAHTATTNGTDGGASQFPEANLSGATPKWFKVSATNRFKMFDASAVTQTTHAENGIDVTLATGRGNTLYLGGLDAQTVVLTGTAAGEVVYERTIDLGRSDNVHNLYDYLYEPIIRRTDLTISDLPQYGALSLRIQILKPGSIAKCGTLIFGSYRIVGEVQTKPKVRIVDYSRIETNEFGVTSLVRRTNVRSVAFDLFVENNLFDEVCRLMGEYTATPLLWSGGEGPEGEFESLNLFGILKDFGGVVDSAGGTFCNLEILGLNNVN